LGGVGGAALEWAEPPKAKTGPQRWPRVSGGRDSIKTTLSISFNTHNDYSHRTSRGVEFHLKGNGSYCTGVN
jgi:hypothetical protein